ncbi:hypothetical protein ACFW1A_03875 [Kitasatospora sp. NPDC058965]|uniref:hypothetical protein n=1 Tax=Kitasatospora sp. NPDC058965 TaxID=3346682 RepID=UPI0036B6BBEA
MASKAVLFEAGRYDWAAYRCACGETAAHLPETFERLVDATNETQLAENALEDHAFVQDLLYQSAVPTTALIMMALQDHELWLPVRQELLDVLWRLCAGESHLTEVEAGEPHLELKCRAIARGGIHTLYNDYVNRTYNVTRYLLEVVEDDVARLAHYDAVFDRPKRKRR